MNILSLILTGAFLVGIGLALFQFGSKRKEDDAVEAHVEEPVAVEKPTVIVEQMPVELKQAVKAPAKKRTYKKKPKAATKTKETK